VFSWIYEKGSYPFFARLGEKGYDPLFSGGQSLSDYEDTRSATPDRKGVLTFIRF